MEAMHEIYRRAEAIKWPQTRRSKARMSAETSLYQRIVLRRAHKSATGPGCCSSSKQPAFCHVQPVCPHGTLSPLDHT